MNIHFKNTRLWRCPFQIMKLCFIAIFFIIKSYIVFPSPTLKQNCLLFAGNGRAPQVHVREWRDQQEQTKTDA